MTTEPMIPAAKDQDPEEVADKLSIAAAMWARGETGDALSWLRRAAESASDAEDDMRALELAKAASALSDVIATSGAASQTKAAAAASAPMPGSRPPAPGPGGVGPSKQPPKPPPSKSPLNRPTGRPPGKLPPLPPLRPLGTAPVNPPSASPAAPRSRPPERMHPPSQPKTAVVAAVHSPIADPSDHDETATMPVSPLLLRELEKGDGSVRRQNEPRNEPATPVGSTVAAADEPTGNIGLDDEAHEAHDEHDLRQTMRRQAVEASEPMPESAPHAPLSSQRRGSTDMPRSSDESSRLTHEPQMLPLAVGMRVRLHGSEEGVWVVPEGDDPHQEGVAAILVPVGRDDDLRTVFGRVRR